MTPVRQSLNDKLESAISSSIKREQNSSTRAKNRILKDMSFENSKDLEDSEMPGSKSKSDKDQKRETQDVI